MNGDINFEHFSDPRLRPSDATRLSLLERLRGHDVRAWQDANDLYRPMVQRWLDGLLFQAADVDDLTQEVMLTVSREIRVFEHQGRVGSFRSWLKTIAINRARQFHRQRRVRPTAKGGSVFLNEIKDVVAAKAASTISSEEHFDELISRILSIVDREFPKQSAELFRKHVL